MWTGSGMRLSATPLACSTTSRSPKRWHTRRHEARPRFRSPESSGKSREGGEPPHTRELSPVVKVSVIVPVYNPGPNIDDCIRTLVCEQSLPRDAYEVIFVD